MDWREIGLSEWIRIIAIASASAGGAFAGIWRFFDSVHSRTVAGLKEEKSQIDRRNAALVEENSGLYRKRDVAIESLKADHAAEVEGLKAAHFAEVEAIKQKDREYWESVKHYLPQPPGPTFPRETTGEWR